MFIEKPLFRDSVDIDSYFSNSTSQLNAKSRGGQYPHQQGTVVYSNTCTSNALYLCGHRPLQFGSDF